MKRVNLMVWGIMVMFVTSCSVIKDPMGKSIDDIQMSRSKATTKVVNRSILKVQEDVRILAERKGWTLFHESPKEDCQVLIGIPHGIDTTETGVFVTKSEEGKTLVEVTSMNRRQQEVVANALFQILDNPWELKK
jgi:hypothetical protein